MASSNQVLAELKELVLYRRRYLSDVPGAGSILALGLSSRKNLCVHPQVAGVDGSHVWMDVRCILLWGLVLPMCECM